MLTSKGYKISKNEYPDYKKILKELRVKPKQIGDFKTQSFDVFRESRTSVYLPKFFGIGRWGVPSVSKERVGDYVDFNAEISLRPTQISLSENILETIKTKDSAILCLQCGGGKTVVSLWIASQLKKKTLVLVNKEFLMNQWKNRIREFLPGARIGIIRQDVCDVENKDIVIGMIQSIIKRQYSREVFDSFGFSIFDECHHICTRTFSETHFHVGTKMCLGLSATPNRKDKLDVVLKWFLGDIVTPPTQSHVPPPDIKFIKAEYSDKIEITYNKLGKINLPNLITKITTDLRRNEQIVEVILNLALESRKILLLTDRRLHCLDIYKSLLEHNLDCGLYLGGSKENELDLANTKNIICATYAMAKEGYDNPKLDTLILASSRSDIEQSIGRIQRKVNLNTPLVVDIYDNLEGLYGQFQRRKIWYKRKGCHINNT